MTQSTSCIHDDHELTVSDVPVLQVPFTQIDPFTQIHPDNRSRIQFMLKSTPICRGWEIAKTIEEACIVRTMHSLTQ